MSSKDRIARLKARLRDDILNSAMEILKKEGSKSLSLRKIADRIEYSAPVIYSYFKDKKDILIELCLEGYEQLNLRIQSGYNDRSDTGEKLANLLVAYWDFAYEEKELYSLMNEMGVVSHDVMADFPELSNFLITLETAIISSTGYKNLSCTDLRYKAYACLGLMHGLISVSFFWKMDTKSYTIIRDDMISAFVFSLTCSSVKYNLMPLFFLSDEEKKLH